MCSRGHFNRECRRFSHHSTNANTLVRLPSRRPDRQQSTQETSMRQVIVQGRGGQGRADGGQPARGRVLRAGLQVQCFASYGGARRGTPVSSYLRVDEKPIRVRCDIERADAILCFDASLLEGRLLAAAARAHADRRQFGAQCGALRRACRAPRAAGRRPGIARQHGLGRIVNSALLGALARGAGRPSWRSADPDRGGAGAAPARREHRRLRAGWHAMAAQPQDEVMNAVPPVPAI